MISILTLNKSKRVKKSKASRLKCVVGHVVEVLCVLFINVVVAILAQGPSFVVVYQELKWNFAGMVRKGPGLFGESLLGAVVHVVGARPNLGLAPGPGLWSGLWSGLNLGLRCACQQHHCGTHPITVAVGWTVQWH